MCFLKRACGTIWTTGFRLCGLSQPGPWIQPCRLCAAQLQGARHRWRCRWWPWMLYSAQPAQLYIAAMPPLILGGYECSLFDSNTLETIDLERCEADCSSGFTPGEWLWVGSQRKTIMFYFRPICTWLVFFQWAWITFIMSNYCGVKESKSINLFLIIKNSLRKENFQWETTKSFAYLTGCLKLKYRFSFLLAEFLAS